MFRRVGGATRERAQPGQQLFKGKRLQQVIVRPSVQSGHPVVNRITGSEDQDGRAHAALAQFAANSYAVEFWQQDVQHNQVESDCFSLIQRFATREGRVHGIALLLKPTLDIG